MKNKTMRIFAAALALSMAVLGSGAIVFAEQAAKETEVQTELESGTATEAEVLEDGAYSVTFKTDSTMFRVNEANDDKGVLTVKDKEMMLHVSLAGKGILNLFVGTAADAKKDGAELLEPTIDTVTYSDGATEEVYGFDIPVKVLGEEFDLALIGKKGKWYDHKVSVTDPEKLEETEAESETESEAE